MTATRHRNNGIRKTCGCPRRGWAKCPHSWRLNYKNVRIAIDRLAGRHIESKTEAEELAAEARKQIRNGTFGRPAPRQAMTLQELVDLYLERYVKVNRPARESAFRGQLNVVLKQSLPHARGAAPFGAWRLGDIVTDTVEVFREQRRAAGTGATGTNRYLGALRAVFNWAVRVGYVDRTPFKRGSESVVRLAKEAKRSRRLDADTDEAGRLLAACAPHLRAVVECALETGMRRGEILSLQWEQVVGLTLTAVEDRWDMAWARRAELFLPAAKTKTRSDRRIPISQRLRAVLELRRLDPAGQPYEPHHYVFGNALGQRVIDIKRAWMTAVLKAHGHKAVYTKGTNLAEASRVALHVIGLRFHDLRREAGSRWLEGGVPLHTVRDWLGHTSIAQTSTYLAGTLKTSHDAMLAFDAGRVQESANGGETEADGGMQTGAGADTNTRKHAVPLPATLM